MSAYRLVSFKICPFVQRSAILLEEKGIEYDIEYIDLANKPEWFLKISPLGKVPLLQVGETILFESAVIAQFLDETTPSPVTPTDPLERAKQRMWAEFTSAGIMDEHRLMVAPTAEDAKKHAAALQAKFRRLEAEVQGPLFAGEHFTLMDACAAPLLQRAAWIRAIAPELGLFEGCPAVSTWCESLIGRSSVIGSTVSDIHEIFKAYLKGGGSPSRKADCSWLGEQIDR